MIKVNIQNNYFNITSKYLVFWHHHQWNKKRYSFFFDRRIFSVTKFVVFVKVSSSFWVGRTILIFIFSWKWFFPATSGSTFFFIGILFIIFLPNVKKCRHLNKEFLYYFIGNIKLRKWWKNKCSYLFVVIFVVLILIVFVVFVVILVILVVFVVFVFIFIVIINWDWDVSYIISSFWWLYYITLTILGRDG